MQEFVTNKVNPYVEPSLHIWGWDVAIYLFLGGLAGGLLIISAGMVLFQKADRFREAGTVFSYPVRMASLLSPVLLGVGMFFLFLDLEYKIHFWRFYTNFTATSPMSWGSWMLLLFFPTSTLQALIVWKEFCGQYKPLKKLIDWAEPWLSQIAVINVHMGAGIGVYTGILLSTFYARPLWNTSILGFVFLLSGMSCAAALMLWMAPRPAKPFYTKLDMYLIAMEGFATTLFIIGGLSGSQNVAEAMTYLIAGEYAPWFWVMFVMAGLIIPLILETLEVLHKVKFSPIVPVLVIIGSLSLRFIIVYAGQDFPTFA